MRPQQWVKNLFVFAALLFSGNLFVASLSLTVILTFFIFCLVSGSSYLLNDIFDLESDKVHPFKSKRPLITGQLKVSQSLIAAIITVLFSLYLSFSVGFYLGLVVLVYFLLMVVYNLFLKDFIIADVIIISCGFVLRVMSGALAISVEVSPWLFICTIFIALFLASAKRRHELILLEGTLITHRKVFEEYSSKLLDLMIIITATSALTTYAVYSVSPRIAKGLYAKNLIFTIPFVIYGIFRYLYLIYKKNSGGNPEITLLRDKPSVVNISLWVLAVIVAIYL
jgi:4-hydroxybenzoate polyprenyltransferase